MKIKLHFKSFLIGTVNSMLLIGVAKNNRVDMFSKSAVEFSKYNGKDTMVQTPYQIYFDISSLIFLLSPK